MCGTPKQTSGLKIKNSFFPTSSLGSPLLCGDKASEIGTRTLSRIVVPTFSSHFFTKQRPEGPTGSLVLHSCRDVFAFLRRKRVPFLGCRRRVATANTLKHLSSRSVPNEPLDYEPEIDFGHGGDYRSSNRVSRGESE